MEEQRAKFVVIPAKGIMEKQWTRYLLCALLSAIIGAVAMSELTDWSFRKGRQEALEKEQKEAAASIARRAAVFDSLPAPVVQKNKFAEAFSLYNAAELRGANLWPAMNDMLKTADTFSDCSLVVYSLKHMVEVSGKSAVSQGITPEVAEKFRNATRIRLASATDFDDTKSAMYVVQEMSELSPLFSDLLAPTIEKMRQYAGANFENWRRVEEYLPTEDVVKKMAELAKTWEEWFDVCFIAREHNYPKIAQEACQREDKIRHAEVMERTTAK